jgi:tetratricopeptide (TPR) repeat protein
MLRVARDQLTVSHPLDAEAAWLLGKIREEAKQPREAISFYQSVLESHPESHAALLSLIGRGECRIALQEDAAGLSDLHDVTNKILAKPADDEYRTAAMTGLRQSSAALATRADFQGALELLSYEQQLQPEPPPEFFARLASVYERRADQLDQSKDAPATEADGIRHAQQIADLRTHAGDAYIAFSRALTLADDRGHAEAMWRGVDLYDAAGATQRAISALELFVAERPDDGQTPEALLRLGRTYQAAGEFDKAIDAFQHNQFRYPQSLAASQSGVPLAQAFIAKGPDQYPKAEKVLLGVIDSPLIRPDAKEFRQALFELAQLFYRTGRYEEAIARLQEMTERYPNDEHMGQLLFLMGDSYRKSASLLVKLASDNPADGAGNVAADLAEAAAAKKDRLSKAKDMFDRVVEVYRLDPPETDLDKLYLKLGHFYRADCLFDLGQYEEAIKLYDAATLRYQDDPAALAAYVQIVNAYCALGRTEEARTANERAKWLLRRMPPDAFSDGSFSMPKEYWEQWLKWTSESGIWPKPGAPVASLMGK